MNMESVVAGPFTGACARLLYSSTHTCELVRRIVVPLAGDELRLPIHKLY
jgi:hypothetical protein